jgi:dTDP-4-dehydrorhamnose reductase
MPTVLILGASGLIGSTIARFLQKQVGFEVHAASRNCPLKKYFHAHNCDMSYEGLKKLLEEIRPAFVINCVGLTKHLASATSDSYLFPNILVPLSLKRLKSYYSFSFVQVSSDCVFSGSNAPYTDAAQPDALDNYGATKAVAETILEVDAMILRTSTVGHEHTSNHGLLDWFLSQSGPVDGYKKAFFNGVTTLTLAKLIHNLISSKDGFQTGIYNVASERISKYDFLSLVREVYDVKNVIIPEEKTSIDRCLVQSQHINRFQSYSSWSRQITDMKEEYYDGVNQ